MVIGLLGALAAAVCYGSGSVLQSVGSRRIAGQADLDPRLLIRLAGQLPYLAGLALDLLGFAASIVALRTLPLFLVQSAVAASVGVTAVLAARFLGARLRPVQLAALTGLGAGLVLLALSARPESAAKVPLAGQWIVLAGALAVLALGLGSARVAGPWGAAGLAAAAGLAFGGVGISARILDLPSPWWRIVTEPPAYALAAYGILGTLLFATALQRGSVTTLSAVLFAAETVAPAAAGLLWLGDSARPGYGWAAAAGFVLTVGCAIELARHDTAHAPPAGAPRDHAARA
ncbi:MAG: putative integral rane protein [Actinomycetia bacterium]|nr:putative integral rane protein [Actinomycetes bacterium]